MSSTQVTLFAEQLRRYRRERGLTQQELGERAGLSARGIRALEQGERRYPHKETMQLLGEALGLSPDQRVEFEYAAPRVTTEPEPRSQISGWCTPTASGRRVASAPSHPGPIVGREGRVSERSRRWRRMLKQAQVGWSCCWGNPESGRHGWPRKHSRFAGNRFPDRWGALLRIPTIDGLPPVSGGVGEPVPDVFLQDPRRRW